MASTASSSSSMLPTLSIPNISHLVSIKLSDTNYLVWESQVKLFLLEQNLWRFIDGSYPCPPQTITPLSLTEKSSNLPPKPIPNPNFTSYSKGIWDCPCQKISQQSLANETQLKFDLFSITKGSKTISYLSHAKYLADHLAAINASVSNTDLVAYVLRGLGPDYQMQVTAILNFPPSPPSQISVLDSLPLKANMLLPLKCLLLLHPWPFLLPNLVANATPAVPVPRTSQFTPLLLALLYITYMGILPPSLRLRLAHFRCPSHTSTTTSVLDLPPIWPHCCSLSPFSHLCRNAHYLLCRP
ncbi:hypothetical protein L3X38_010345 [Prunus dulcis]|uniref:Retrotransposon Copia-like N-terminal domain-containing protein n=1 Tax=Prunus dulcis TaxID=3755 RepID=A0AAD4WFA2_PRUDU|nr:hypothetical protein L3X38_010345 [Prunus dulcis]